MKHDEYREALALYALGSLETDEARDVAAHLVDCGECSRELGELRETAASLACATDAVEPSRAAARRILDVPRLEPRHARAGAVIAAADRAPRARRWRPLPMLSGVAAVAVIAFLVVSQVNLVSQLDVALEAVTRFREIGDFVTSPDVTVISLWGTGAKPSAHAKLAYDARLGTVMLFPSHLPGPPQGKTYQLWVISDRMRPAGAFTPDAPGGTVLSYRPAAGEGRSFVFGVTVEPASGSDEPTGEMVLLSGPLGDR